MAERVNKNGKELKKSKRELGVRRIFCGPRVQRRGNPSVKGGKMTGGRTRAVFGETLCLPARSRFGEGRAAPLPV
jgi:hypothetical protein